MKPDPVHGGRFYQAAGEDRRSRMQAKLMDAAVGLFAEVGVEAASVLEITSRAGVANGTFYNYFRDLQEIVEVIYSSITTAVSDDIVERLDRIDDARDQIALGTIWFTDAVATDPHWGRVVMQALEQGPFREHARGVISKYIQSGLGQGHFQVDCTPVLLDLYLAVLAAAIRSRLERDGPEGQTIGFLAAEMHLRMLGTPATSAHEIPSQAHRRHGAFPSASIPRIQPGRRHGEASVA